MLNYTPEQIEAINTVNENLQIIACAGSGKTQVISQRIVNILKNEPSIQPQNIVAFTYTEKAAAELKSRVLKLCKEQLPDTKGLVDMYIGTIHSWCLKVLQEHIYEYQKFLQLAEYADKVLSSVKGREISPFVTEKLQPYSMAAEPEVSYGRNTQNFWIRNQRNIYFTYGTRKYYPDFIIFKDGFIYVIETKGEIYSDTRKNVLLKKLDEVPGDATIKGFRGILIFSTQLDEMGEDYIGFDDFIKASEEILRRHQSKADLIQDPPAAERFIKYIPVYQPIKAYKKFIKKQKTPKPDGWLEVKENPDGYPDTVFATQAKGDALNPKYRHNDWIYLNHVEDKSEALNNLSLVFNGTIEDEYDPGCTIRVVETIEKESSSSLFNEKEIHLKPYNKIKEPIVITDVHIGEEVEIVAVEYLLDEDIAVLETF
ncbi:MAG: hypothetical protein A2Z47_06360 [Thermodesulfovibrio sp. RBG_19FT_COMBO_42_12]|nr:MAG: hypothetical protein A2Z47_06360 [Thermodesulfovibrio sp. RBG_19FT_COMBO_42_12]